MLSKDVAISWIEECQKAFDKIKEYLSKSSVLVPLEPERLLLMYLSVLDRAFGCVLGQHDVTGRKEQAVYYLSKKFTPYEAWMDPPKYIFQKPMPVGKFAKWQILVSEFDIIYVTKKVVKGQELADHLAENPIDGECEPLKMYFPDEQVTFSGEDIAKTYAGWRMLFDGAANFKRVGIEVVLVSEIGQHYPVEAASYKAVAKKVVTDFIRDRIVCRFGVSESIITNNSANLNNDLMKAMCETFKIKHQNSTAYRPQMNGAVEAANKNINKILSKIVDNCKQ
ncbi:uncharacterized protein [Nicotiana tomentosiformis]|uniref:uncharacterized protein n=1 Tax=Nicotiana tomentosiformis TaxID=4098 RepID=UPI00388C7D77